MVFTRRGTANAEQATAEMERPKLIRPASDTIHVLIPSTKKVGKASLRRKVPSTPPNMTISSTISEHDLSLTSPSTGETPELLTMSTPKNKQGSPELAEQTVSSALRRLAPKPFANRGGSCHNPIIVDETFSPPRKVVRAPKRRHRHKRLPEPHQFVSNGYRDLYSYRVSRPALAAVPANGSNFTGHQSHDIYRMMNAKIIAAPDFSLNVAWGRNTLNVPFEVQYPLSAQVLAQQASYQQSPYVQYHQVQAPSNVYGHPMVPSQDEELLCRRAVQCIREFSRPSLQKRRLFDADPDKTSDDEAEEHQQHIRPQQSMSDFQSGSMSPTTVRNFDCHINHEPTVHRDPDSNLLVGHFIEHTSLIASLLKLYPHSADRKGLQNDISMMVQVQNQHVTDWMRAESRNSRKRRKNNSGSTVRLDGRSQLNTPSSTKIQNENDDTLRQVFSANADMWQDGTGHGVADVYAVVPASSPVVSSFDGKIAGPTHVPSDTSTAHGLPIKKQIGTTGNTVTTPTKRVPTSTAGAAHGRDMPTTLSMEDIRAKLDQPSINIKGRPKHLTNLSLSSSPSEDSATPTKTTPHRVNDPITPSPNRKHNPSSSHRNHSKRTKDATTQCPAPSSNDDELHAPKNGNISSNFHSASSSDVRKLVFRFEQRVDAVDGQVGANPLLKE